MLSIKDPWPHWIFEDPASGDQLRLVPERGGLLTGWRCGGREILYLDADRFADPALSVRGGMPVLFPICGNLHGDQLPLPGGSYPMRQHGFACAWSCGWSPPPWRSRRASTTAASPGTRRCPSASGSIPMSPWPIRARC